MGSLRIALRPFFSGVWLAYRLNSFWGKWPQIRIDLIHAIKVLDFNTENIDLGILWGKGDWPGLQSYLLVPGNLTPICSAEFIKEHGRPVTPADLAKYTLIHDEDHSAWDAWVEKANAGAGALDFSANLTIDDTNVRLQSILNNQGIMLGCPTMLKKFLDDGTLVQLFDICLDTLCTILERVKSYSQTGVDAICTFGLTNPAILAAIREVTALPVMVISYGENQLGGNDTLATSGVRVYMRGHTPFEKAVNATYQSLVDTYKEHCASALPTLTDKNTISTFSHREHFDRLARHYTGLIPTDSLVSHNR